WRCASARISMSSFRLVSMALRDPSKHQHEAAVDELAGQQLEAARRQRDAALEMTVRDLEAVDRVARGGALPAHRGDHEVRTVGAHLERRLGDSGKRDADHERALALHDVDR